MYVADAGAGTVYRVDKANEITILAEGLRSPCCLGLDRKGRLLVSHELSEESSDSAPLFLGAVSRISRDGERTLVVSGLQNTQGLLVDPQRRIVLAAEGFAYEGQILGAGLFKIDDDGELVEFIDLGAIKPSGLALGLKGSLWLSGVAEGEGSVYSVDSDGSLRPFLLGLTQPRGIAATSSGLYVADEAAGEVWKMDIRKKDASDSPPSVPSYSHEDDAYEHDENEYEHDDGGYGPHPNENHWGYRGKPNYRRIPITPEGVPSAASGVTSVIGRVLRNDDIPLGNVTVRLGRKAIRTNSQGYWILADVPGGKQVVMFDGRSADDGDVHYPISMLAWELDQGRPNRLPFNTFFPILDTAHTTRINRHGDTIHTTPLIPGLEIHIPKGAKLTSVDGKRVKEITATLVPFEKPLYPMNLTPDFGNHFTIQPGGSVSDKPIKIIYNNPGKFPAGTRIKLWEYSPMEKGGWTSYGTGTVTADAQRIVPDEGIGLSHLGCALSGHANSTHIDQTCAVGHPVDVGTGVFFEESVDLVLPGLMPLVLKRTYRNKSNNNFQFGVNMFTPFDVRLYGSPDEPELADERNNSKTFYLESGSLDPRVHSDTTDFRYAGAKIVRVKSSEFTTHDGHNYFLFLKDGTRYGFNGAGYLSEIRDPHQNGIKIERGVPSCSFRISKITQLSGRFIQFEYNNTDVNSNMVSRAVDSSGRAVNYAYDSSSRLIAVTNAAQGVTRYDYDAQNNITNIVLPNTVNAAQNTYDADNRVTRQVLPNGGVFSFSYSTNASGVISQVIVTNPALVVKTFNLNTNSGFVTSMTDCSCSGAGTNTFIRNASNQAVEQTIDPLGRTNSFAYDGNANLTNFINAAGKVTSFTYDSSYNRLTSVIDPLNRTNSFGIGSGGNVTSITDANGKVTQITYNEFGLPLTVIDPLSQTHSFSYSDSMDLVTITDPLGNQVRRQVDSLGRPLALVDALGRRTKIGYDAMSNVTNIVDALNGTTSFTYDTVDNLLSVTDAKSNTVRYVYDSMNNLIARTNQLIVAETYSYDLMSNLTNYVDRRGTIVKFQHDTLDRRTGIVYGAESSVQFLYDAGNRVTNVVDSLAGTIELTYDALNQLTKETNANGTVSYEYNDGGQRTNMTVTGQSAVRYKYDVVGRLTNVVQSGDSAKLFYDDAGRRTKLTLPNAINVLYGYDAASRVTNITYQAAQTNQIVYTYDDTGNRSAQISGFSTYNLPTAVSTSSYNAANQQLVFGTYNNQYDANGNVTNIINGSTTNILVWTARNQLTNMAGAVAASFLYDGLGRRVTRTVSGVTQKYVYDGLDILIEKDGGGSIQAKYLRGLGIDEPWLRKEVAHTPTSSGLIGHWKADEGTGTTVTNSSGGVITGTFSGGTTWTADGALDNALSFDGDNDVVSFGDVNALEDQSNAFTVSTWVKLNSFPTSHENLLLFKDKVLLMSFRTNFPDQISFRVGNGTTFDSFAVSAGHVQTGVWTHVAVSYTNSTVKFYIDGRLTDTQTQTYTMGNNGNSFQFSHSSRTLDGKLDDVRYYNCALSDADIGEIAGEAAFERTYLADALGSIIALTDENKNIASRYGYDPFGGASVTGSRNPYRFTGREDDGTGLYSYRARYHHPLLGRFVSEDPLEYAAGDVNLYGYVGNAPIRTRDPLGLDGNDPPTVVTCGPGGRGYYEWRDQPPLGATVITAVKYWLAMATYGAGRVLSENWPVEAPGCDPKPPGCDENWGRGYGPHTDPDRPPSWWDPNGGEGSRHEDGSHDPHWDNNPHRNPADRWQDIDDDGQRVFPFKNYNLRR